MRSGQGRCARAAVWLATLALVALIAAPTAGAHPARFDVGTSVADITPAHPQFLGGYDRMDTPTSNLHDPLQVRAFFVAHGRHAVAFAIVDSQGWFAGYQEGPFGVTDARAAAARGLRREGYAVGSGNLIVSSTHSHAAPTIMGIWGRTDPDYLRQIHDATVRAIVDAARHTHASELWTGSGSIDDIVAQNVEGTDHFDGWGIDDQTPVLWARDPHTGATNGLYVDVPVHPDEFRGSKYRQMSADYPGAVRAELDRAVGGTAVVAEGTLGRQESMGSLDDYPEVEKQARFVTNAIERGLARARPITSTQVAGAQQYIAVPGHNAALLLLLYANTQGFSCNDTIGACTIDRSIEPPYLAGNVIGTWVTTLRIGDVAWSSEPGEAFPEVSNSIRAAVGGAAAVHVVGMAQDQLGYFYPPEDYPSSELNPSDFILFNVSPTLADETVDAAALNANRLGFRGVPQHPTPFITQPHAYFEPGVQFWPGVVESDSPTVTFLPEGRPSQAPSPTGHTVSAVTLDYGDGASDTLNGDAKTRVSHTYARPGRYDVTITAHDEQGQVRTWTRPVIVDPPLAATATARHGTLEAGVRGGDGHAIAAHWSFSDGTGADGLTVPGRRRGLTATVTVVDGAGDTATTTLTT